MVKQTWSVGDLHLEYSNPMITGFYGEEGEREVKSEDDVMYFYYDITIFNHETPMFIGRARDCPLVFELPRAIDKILDHDTSKSYVMVDEEDAEYEYKRKELYTHIDMCDPATNDYFYRIERYDHYVKNHDGIHEWKEFVLTIGNMHGNRRSPVHPLPQFGQVVMLKELRAKDLLALKKTAEAFGKQAIMEHEPERKDE